MGGAIAVTRAGGMRGTRKRKWDGGTSRPPKKGNQKNISSDTRGCGRINTANV
jgi:hypothetical protein